ncbi:MAG TPA: glycosyltransferase family 87 protein [Anaerolineales bacterium]|jgi:hypothetical protein
MTKKSSLAPLNTAWIGWIVASGLIAASVIATYAWKGAHGLDAIALTGPFSKFWLTIFAATHTWLLGGLLLWLLKSGRIDRDNAFTWAGFFLVSFLYINLLRERLDYGDLHAYFLGASNLYRGEPLDSLYIYPPFWAMLLKPLVPYGENVFLYATWNLNVLMMMAFYFLLHNVLRRYDFSTRLAAVAVTLFMLVNVALLRTLYYMQINLHVLNLIFISLLLYPRSRWLSALALSLAIHLKVSPLVLALAFVLERDWRWLAWLAFFTLAVFALTVLSDGFRPYLDYLHNLSQLNLPRVPIFRETSFDSFFWSVAELLKLDGIVARIAIYASKAALAAAAFAVMLKAVRAKAFATGRSASLLNALPPLMILMNMASPLVWEHHALFLVIACMVLLRGLETSAEWTWFGIAYFTEFLVPTIDLFPWSYARMLAPLVVLWLLWRVAQRPGETSFFRNLNRRVEKAV